MAGSVGRRYWWDCWSEKATILDRYQRSLCSALARFPMYIDSCGSTYSEAPPLQSTTTPLPPRQRWRASSGGDGKNHTKKRKESHRCSFPGRLEGPRRPHEGSETAQNDPQTALDGLKMTQDVSKIASRRSRRPRRRPKRAPRGPLSGPPEQCICAFPRSV